MATKTIVQLTDDLDPSLEATDTIRFALGNVDYEIDLWDEHINELRSTSTSTSSTPGRSGAGGGPP